MAFKATGKHMASYLRKILYSKFHTKPRSYFLALPTEIRVRIYELVIQSSCYSYVQNKIPGRDRYDLWHYVAFPPPAPHVLRKYSGLTLSCRQIYSEFTYEALKLCNAYVARARMLWHAIEPSIPLDIVRPIRPGERHWLRVRGPVFYDMTGRGESVNVSILLDLLSDEDVEITVERGVYIPVDRPGEFGGRDLSIMQFQWKKGCVRIGNVNEVFVYNEGKSESS